MKNAYIKKLIICILATIVIGVSIAMMRFVDLGVDPFTSLIIGICNITNIAFRLIYPIINALILLIVFFVNRPMVGMGTLINLLLIGPVSDYSTMFLEKQIQNPTPVTKFLILAIGLVIMAMGVSLYTSTNIGTSAYDSLFITIHKKNPKISLGLARIITDAISIVIGYLGKAILGIGTILNVFLMGPMVEFFNKTTSKKILDWAGLSLDS